MTGQLASSVPEVEAFWLVRGGGTVEITPCPDGASQWHWRFIPTEPDIRMVPTGGGRIDENGSIVPEMREVEIEPEVVHATTEQIMCNLTLEEGRLFIGYACHLHEHLFAHLGTCITALQTAWDERRLSGIDALTTEVLMANRMRCMVADAAKSIYEST